MDARLAQTNFVVEASSFERHTIVEKWRASNITCDDEGASTVFEVGSINRQPVMIECTWMSVDGVHVMFYFPTSRVVDFVQIDDWLKAHCNPVWAAGERRALCEAWTSGQCLEYILHPGRR